MKRGQITYFIIAGLIILIAVLMVISARFDLLEDFYKEQKTRFVSVPSEIEPVKEYIKGCLREVGDDGITLVMLQGGYLYPNLNPGIYKSYNAIDIAYWYEKKDLSPDINDIKNDIESYVNEILPSCIDSIENEFLDYNINYNIIKTNVQIKNKEMIFNTNIDLDIEYKGKTYRIDNVISSVETDAVDVFNSAKLLFNDIKSSNNKLNLNKDYKYDINLYYSEDDQIYSIYSDNVMINFAVSFPEMEEI